jgi:hypothetical protein
MKMEEVNNSGTSKRFVWTTKWKYLSLFRLLILLSLILGIIIISI